VLEKGSHWHCSAIPVLLHPCLGIYSWAAAWPPSAAAASAVAAAARSRLQSALWAGQWARQQLSLQ